MILPHNVLVFDVVAVTDGTATAIVACIATVAFSTHCVQDTIPVLH